MQNTEGGIHEIDLARIRPMVAHPGNPDEGVPSIQLMVLTLMKLERLRLILLMRDRARLVKMMISLIMPKFVSRLLMQD